MSVLERISDLEEKISKIIDGLDVMSQWVNAQEQTTRDYYEMFKILDEKVTKLENRSSALG